MSDFYGENVADRFPDRERFRRMRVHDLANAMFAAGCLLQASGHEDAGEAVIEGSGRIREPAIGRLTVAVLSAIVGACIALAIYTSVTGHKDQARMGFTVIEKAQS